MKARRRSRVIVVRECVDVHHLKGRYRLSIRAAGVGVRVLDARIWRPAARQRAEPRAPPLAYRHRANTPAPDVYGAVPVVSHATNTVRPHRAA